MAKFKFNFWAVSTSFKVHIREAHQSVSQVCPHCEKCFNQEDLKAHILEVNKVKIKFNCTFCKASYVEKRELRGHVRNVHL